MAIKFKFNPNRDYQIEAVNSVVDIFQGLDHEEDLFTVNYETMGADVSDKGYANKRPLASVIRENIKSIQERNQLMITDFDGLNVSVEMETGTGKTYVYLDTIVQLYKKYNFRKFIILVPSVAIREGVHSSIEMLKEHFKAKHDMNNITCGIYSGGKVGQVIEYASSPNLEILIMNIDSFNKDTNILRRDDIEDYRGVAPIEFLKSTNPFIIIDEPQSVEGKSDKAKAAIEDLNPCFIARYSATHVEKYSMVYKLDPIDAYNKGLVKQISVSSLTVGENKNRAHIVLKKFNNAGNPVVELNVISNNGKSKKVEKECKNGARLIDITKNDLYEGHILTNWNIEQGWIEVKGEKHYLFVETEAQKDDFKKAQIKETIYRHLLKDLKLRKKGIKVLSLFFIDKVANYRQDGKYYQWFEQLLEEFLCDKKFESLREFYEVTSCHKGYFAVDKKGTKDSTGKSADDIKAYDLIMKGKEELISLSNKVHFIFSHSALREGWDNPNVFQICTLNETDKDKSKVKMRQELGRGLRLCVDNQGNVITDRELNQLTVIVNESYEDFAEKLQSEIVEDLALETFEEKVRILSKYVLNNEMIGSVRAQEILNCLIAEKLIKTEKKKLKYTKKAVEVVQSNDEEKLLISNEPIAEFKSIIFSFMKDQIKVPQKPVDINNECENRVRIELTHTEEFKALKNVLEQESKFNITLNPDEIISRIMEDYRKENYIVANKYDATNTEIEKMESDGALVDTVGEQVAVYMDQTIYHYEIDVVRKLMNATKLSRKTIIDLLKRIGDKHDIKDIYINPQHFVERMSDKISATLTDILKSTGLNYEKSSRTVDNVIRLEPQTINFDPEDKRFYKVKNASCLYDFIQCDSDVEREIAEILDSRENVKLFFKLESSFKIKTPVGNYSPDWAIIKDNPEKPISFIVESKHSINKEDLRGVEQLKIHAASKHFYEVTGNHDFFRFTNANGVKELVDRSI